MFSIRLLFSNSYNPWFNLAAEDYIFRNMPEYQCILFLWRNYDTVVIGRAQNPWKECNTRRMEQDGIPLVRRSTGGGSVFHDLGNTCFTFMSKKSKIEEDNCFPTHVILNGLKYLGIDAFLFGRNDIVVQTDLGNRKISGLAYRKTNYGQLHHGTLLLNTNLNKLTYYLTPDEKKLTTKGISSVRARVVNLTELQPNINHEILCESLKKSFFNLCNKTVSKEKISCNSFSDNLYFSKILSKQQSWEWNFGNVPDFSQHLNTRFDWGEISLHFNIENGIISKVRIFTDSLYPEPLEELSYRLTNLPYNSKSIRKCCLLWLKTWPKNIELLEVNEWLLKSIS